jgi:tRNA N6-adenosine threonylcarbamoyltransferase
VTTADVPTPVVLGLESSCDETSAAVIDGQNRILGHVILSQDEHAVFGGVIPEIAARAHLRKIDSVVDETLLQAGVTLQDIDIIGATAGPGLIGALLVGVCWAKSAAFALDRPFVPVHHMEAHLFAPSLEDEQAVPPFVALLVSGGHTMLLHVPAWGEYRLLGETRDDAAGEAFDKVAKLLGLAYPGGPEIQRVAAEGDPKKHTLPRPMLRRNHTPDDAAYYDFSFSGLKTAAVDLTRRLGPEASAGAERPHIASAFQEAAVDVLASKTMRAVDETGCGRVLLGGGVSANLRLRDVLSERLGQDGQLFHASPRLSLDNGAMVARAARFRHDAGGAGGLDSSASAGLAFPGLVRASVV